MELGRQCQQTVLLPPGNILAPCPLGVAPSLIADAVAMSSGRYHELRDAHPGNMTVHLFDGHEKVIIGT